MPAKPTLPSTKINEMPLHVANGDLELAIPKRRPPKLSRKPTKSAALPIIDPSYNASSLQGRPQITESSSVTQALAQSSDDPSEALRPGSLGRELSSPSSQVKLGVTKDPSIHSGGTSTSRQGQADADVLYCLMEKAEKEVPERRFYRSEPWIGIAYGEPGKGSAQEEGEKKTKAVLTYYTKVKLKDETKKTGNSSLTWREQPTDLEIGRDATVIYSYPSEIFLYSKRLAGVLEKLMDYYPPKSSDFSRFIATSEGCFVDLLLFYAELKIYHRACLKSIQAENHSQRTSNDYAMISNTGDSGDDEVANCLSLHFGALNFDKVPDAPATAYDIAVLLRLLAPLYKNTVFPTLESISGDSERLVSYDRLWVLFRPGTFVYAHQDNELCVRVVLKGDYKYKEYLPSRPEDSVDRFVLQLWHCTYDGHRFQRKPHRVSIAVYPGRKALLTLEAYPCIVYDRIRGQDLRQHLERRGMEYLSLCQEVAAHRLYNDERSLQPQQVIIDHASHNRYSKDQERYRYRRGYDDDNDVDVDMEDGFGGERFRDFIKIDLSNYRSHQNIAEVALLLPGKIGGFSLMSKQWDMFSIDKISKEPPSEAPNSQLEKEVDGLSQDSLDCLRTVMRKGQNAVEQSSDFIQGKGQGKIFFLYGGPGTGKTLTVECLAVETQRPLLTLTVADIGNEFGSEEKLRMWLDLVTKWSAILLIDEADLFLEQRQRGALGRNSLVTSVLFLVSYPNLLGVQDYNKSQTSNRPGHIDDAFISRITMPIEYAPLSGDSKSRIVERLVNRFQATGTVLFDPEAQRYMVQKCGRLNGRQIRNALKNAIALAEVNSPPQQPSKILPSGASIPQIDLPKTNDSSSDGCPKPCVTIVVKMRHVRNAITRQVDFVIAVDKIKSAAVGQSIKDEAARARGRGDY